jgi:2-polyprenyl-3-methyl-5-hydroxy-6-metoxy-1,4-benzoquinol methylase
MTAAIQSPPCPVCGSRRQKRLRRYDAAHLVRCTDCGLTFTGRRPSDDELAAHYQNYGTSWFDSPVTRERYRELLESFEPYRRANRILDVGCGPGYFLEEAQKCGWDAHGSEFSARALELNRSKGLNVVDAPIGPDTFAPGSFDVITAFEVVEHLRDPLAEAAMLAVLLRSGGLLYCTTPNFNAVSRLALGARWMNIGYPEHLIYFTRRTLQTWLAPFGLAPTAVTTTGFSITAIQVGVSPDSGPAYSRQSADQRLRVAVERSRLLRFGKTTANALLTTVGAGDTLKAWFERT